MNLASPILDKSAIVPEDLKTAVLSKVFIYRFESAPNSKTGDIGNNGRVLAELASVWVSNGYEPISGHLRKKIYRIRAPVLWSAIARLTSAGCLSSKDQKLDLTSAGFKIVWQDSKLRSLLPGNLPIQPDLNFSVIHLDSRHSFLSALKILSEAVNLGRIHGPVKISQIAALLDWDQGDSLTVAKKLLGKDIKLNPSKDGLILTDSGKRDLLQLESAKAAPRQSKVAKSDFLLDALPALIQYVIVKAEKGKGLTKGEIERASVVLDVDSPIQPRLNELVQKGVLKKAKYKPDKRDLELRRFQQETCLYSICDPKAQFPEPADCDFGKLDLSKVFKAFGHSGNFQATQDGQPVIIEKNDFIKYLRAMDDKWFTLKDFRERLKAIQIKFKTLELLKAMNYFENQRIIQSKKSETSAGSGGVIVRSRYQCLLPAD